MSPMKELNLESVETQEPVKFEAAHEDVAQVQGHQALIEQAPGAPGRPQARAGPRGARGDASAVPDHAAVDPDDSPVFE